MGLSLIFAIANNNESPSNGVLLSSSLSAYILKDSSELAAVLE